MIAAKQFQVTQFSSDITFAYELVAVASGFAARISISFDGANVHLTWPDATMNLYEASSPNAPPSGWTFVPNQSAGSATITGVSSQAGGTARFYSLRE